MGSGVDGKDSRKLKSRVDELQTILAAEIKSRNISERELEQQILSARENINQLDGSNDGALAQKVVELTDQLHRTEAALQMESTERLELQKQVDAITAHESTVNSQLKKLQKDLEKEMFMNKVAADERNRHLELIREAESRIIESKEKLAEADQKRIESQRESRNLISNLERAIADQASDFSALVQEKGVYIDQVASDMSASQAKATQVMESKFISFEKKIALMENNLHEALNENLRSLHTDLRIQRENAEANHQEMKEVLSAEITSRRRAIDKSNGKVEKLFANHDDIVHNFQKLKAGVDENVEELNTNVCKVAAGFSDQLITLQDVTKKAVRTLQIDQVSLTAQLKNSIGEYKQLNKIVSGRIDECNSNMLTMEASLKARCKKLDLRIDETNGLVEEKSNELLDCIKVETRKREESVRKVNNTIKIAMEDCYARIDSVATEADAKLCKEATNRSNEILSAEKRQQALLTKERQLTDDKMVTLQETMCNEISYAISIENQTRSRNMQKVSKSLHSRMATLAETTNELIAAEARERSANLAKTKEVLSEFETTLADRAAAIEKSQSSFRDDLRIDFEERDLRSSQFKRRLARRLAREAQEFAETDENLRKLIEVQSDNTRYESKQLEDKLEQGLERSDENLAKEVAGIEKQIAESSNNILLEVEKREGELLSRLKKELMEQLLANHVRAQSYRQRIDKRIASLEVRNCLDDVVNKVAETSVLESVSNKVLEVSKAANSDSSEAKSYVDLATKFLDKKLMAGFNDYDKRLARGLEDVKVEVNEQVLGQVEKNDLALLEHLKKIHEKSHQHRTRLEDGLIKVEVGLSIDRIVNQIESTQVLEVSEAVNSDSSDAKSYVDLATKFLDKKLMAGFNEYDKRLTRGLEDVKAEVNESVLGQVEKNDLALLEHLKKVHEKSHQHRTQIEEGLINVEVGLSLDRIISRVVDNNVQRMPLYATDDSSKWITKTDDKSGRPYYYNIDTLSSQWEPPPCLESARLKEVLSSDPKDTAREEFIAEVDRRINAVGIEVLDRMQKLQARQKENEELIQSYDIPVLLDRVNTLQHEVEETVEELHGVKEELHEQVGAGKKILADAIRGG